jgi:hypothetical protein
LLIVCWLHINAFIHLMNFFTFCYHHVTCELCFVLYFTDWPCILCLCDL